MRNVSWMHYTVEIHSNASILHRSSSISSYWTWDACFLGTLVFPRWIFIGQWLVARGDCEIKSKNIYWLPGNGFTRGHNTHFLFTTSALKKTSSNPISYPESSGFLVSGWSATNLVPTLCTRLPVTQAQMSLLATDCWPKIPRTLGTRLRWNVRPSWNKRNP